MSHILTGTFNHSRWSELFIGLATGINGSLNGLVKQGEPKRADLEVIFRECGGDLTAYFARRHGASDVAADLVQESFLQLARRLRKGEALRSPRAYLFGIARHVSIAFFRKNRSSEGLPNEVEEPAAAEPDARMAAAREIIADLPALQREILDLRFAHGLSYSEMALALGIPVGTVRSRLHNAIELLREKLLAEENATQRRPGTKV